MQILSTTTSVLRVITDAAVNVDVFVSYMDKLGATFTPANQATAISTATTTTIVSAPAASTQRNVKALSIYNSSNTTGVTVTVEFYDGVTAYQIYKAALAPNETLWYEDDYGWVWANNAPIISQQVFTTVGTYTYTTPVGVKAIRIECIGSGGGGGGVAGAASVSGAAGGGGAGAYAAALIQNPAASYSFTIPAGGTGATAGANAGGAGGSTTFGSTLVVAVGGSGGDGDTAAAAHIGGLGGNGGAGSSCTGDDRFDGSAGLPGVVVAAALAVSGSGGNSYYAGGANAVKNSTSAGVAGTKGSGGAGGCNVSGVGGTNVGGAAGGDGVIIVTEYR